jgi:biofilm PGA synthesis lipoprotein PgaB
MIRKIIILMTLFIVTGSSLFAQEYPSVNGVQIFVLDKKYDGNLDHFFSGLKERGLDTVLVRVFHNSVDRYHFQDKNSKCRAGVYFKTDSACMVRDVLGEAVQSARKHGLKIYAWMATRTLSFLKTENYMEKSFRGGELKNGYGFSIFNQDAVSTVVDLFRDLAKYDIDGVLFQDDFILRYREGASDHALHAYKLDTGIEIAEKDLFSCRGGLGETKVPNGCPEVFLPWVEWKNAKMMDFYRNLKIETMKVNPELVFAGNVYYETPLEKAKGLAWYAQTIESMLDNGFDYLAVMGYHDQIAEELRLDSESAMSMVEDIAKSLKNRVDDWSRILLKVQRISFNKTRVVDSRQHDSLCDMLDRHGSISRVVVPVNSLEDLEGSCLGK